MKEIIRITKVGLKISNNSNVVQKRSWFVLKSGHLAAPVNKKIQQISKNYRLILFIYKRKYRGKLISRLKEKDLNVKVINKPNCLKISVWDKTNRANRAGCSMEMLSLSIDCLNLNN